MPKFDFEKLLHSEDSKFMYMEDYINNLLTTIKRIHVIAMPIHKSNNDLVLHRENGLKHAGWSYNIYAWDKDKSLLPNPYCKPGENILGDVFDTRRECMFAAFEYLLKNKEYYKL